jgi:FAD/FMN-containing dehydrogenase/ferredoxin
MAGRFLFATIRLQVALSLVRMKTFKSESQREYYSKDQGELPAFLRKAFARLPHEVVQPRSAAEAVQAVRDASKAGVPIVPRGSASTAFGQTIPVRGGRVLDLGFMNAVVGLDAASRLVSVEAGVRWSDLSAYLEEKGLAVGSHPSSFYTTVGGWIATGGLGIHSLKFGSLKSQTARLRVCLAGGEEKTLEPGDPLFESFFETEGQLGLVLEATLKVRPKPAASCPWLLPAASNAEAWSLLADALNGGFDLSHASFYNAERMGHFNHSLAEAMKRKGSTAAERPVFAKRPSLLLHQEDAADSRRLHAWLKKRGAEIAPAFQASYAWAERFYPLKGKRADRMFLGNEVVIADAKAAGYVDELSRLGAEDGLSLAIEANSAGSGESVVIASFYAPFGDEGAYVRKLASVFRLDEAGHRHGGRLYHVGIYNAPLLERRFDAATLERVSGEKARVDPKGLFNPGKFFDLWTPWTAWMPPQARLAAARLGIRFLQTGLGARLTGLLAPLFAGEKVPKGGLADKVFATARECVSCGFCLPICPAYLATRDERTTARGKLFLAARWLGGKALSAEDVELLHSCMHCAGCTRVCQSELDLVPVWHELEQRVASEYGKPTEAVVGFVKKVEASADYKRLLRRGFIATPAPAVFTPATAPAAAPAPASQEPSKESFPV